MWCRGRAHELTLQSVATRISSVELEADALCTEILNVHELRHEPLRSARSDVRLCQSLNQIWRDENARRAAIGLGRLEDQATGATPDATQTQTAALKSMHMSLDRDTALARARQLLSHGPDSVDGTEQGATSELVQEGEVPKRPLQ